ncbi:MAG: RluA family pseudouridine synthase [Prevotella sp.]|nr:RluA family pseudouridine synthase [Prevotella sp.]
MCFHPLHSACNIPQSLNNPFCYEPHEMCLQAAAEVREYVESVPVLADDARKGKMLGVLVVETVGDSGSQQSSLGFLAAYSGLLAGRNDWGFFVPPVFDAQQPEGHFKQTERAISALNAEIAALLPQSTGQGETESLPGGRLAELKRRRKEMSEELQLWLFRQYRMLNAKGETKDLVEIWRDYHQSEKIRRRFPLPPGGTGDCCAPKLLQYAFSHGLRPVQIAEFWMGASPKGEVRHDGRFYPACRGKCLPVLTYMLGGRFADEAGSSESNGADRLRVVYEDAAVVVVEKPSGLLSVPGRTGAPSVQSLLTERYGTVLLPHRLDMDTSGLLLAARNEEAYKLLQQQFYERTVEKKYVALVDGIVTGSGIISLPLRPDPLDRPRQVVDLLHGKQAVTHYEVLSHRNGQTLLVLTPKTGRTHQLRMHCAHQDGLGTPIVGDNLYGRPDRRLCLHAWQLSFTHPVSNQRVSFTANPIPF